MGVTQSRMDKIEEYLSKENLEKLFSEGYSANYIAKKYFAPDFQTDASIVIARAKKYGIKTLSVKEAARLKNTRDQYRQTVKEKYGVDNVSQATDIKHKKEEKALERYGVKNVFQAEEIKIKARATCLQKYGNEHIGCLGLGKGNRISKQHNILQDILNEMDIYFENEKGQIFKTFNAYLNKEYSPTVDIYIPDHKLVIECYGNLWHANPKFYKANDLIPKYEGRTKALDIWYFDKIRQEQIESLGYNFIYFWEEEIERDRESVKQRIQNIINQKNSI